MKENGVGDARIAKKNCRMITTIQIASPSLGTAATAARRWTEVTTLNIERPASCESALRGQQHQPID